MSQCEVTCRWGACLQKHEAGSIFERVLMLISSFSDILESQRMA